MALYPLAVTAGFNESMQVPAGPERPGGCTETGLPESQAKNQPGKVGAALTGKLSRVRIEFVLRSRRAKPGLGQGAVSGGFAVCQVSRCSAMAVSPSKVKSRIR